MKKINMKGFTLMEVLIVVLIIGILATVSTPYYRQHVEKERSVSGISSLRMFADSLERYMTMHNNEVPEDLSLIDADINIPQGATQYNDGFFTYSVVTGSDGNRYIRGRRNTGDYILGYALTNVNYSTETVICSSPGSGFCKDRLNMTCSQVGL